MAGRVYTLEFAGVTVAAVQDLFSLQSTSGMAFKLIEAVIGPVAGLTTTENVKVSLKRFSGAYTIGSGGSSVTPAKHNNGDAAATCTGRANDTTQTTGGTSVVLRAEDVNEINGWSYLAIPDKEIIIAPSQALVLSLDTAPGASRTVSGTLTFEEVF